MFSVSPISCFHISGGRHPVIAFEPDKRNLGVRLDPAEQIGGKWKRTVKHTQKKRVATAVFLRDLPPEFIDAGRYSFVSDIWLKCQPLYT